MRPLFLNPRPAFGVALSLWRSTPTLLKVLLSVVFVMVLLLEVVLVVLLVQNLEWQAISPGTPPTPTIIVDEEDRFQVYDRHSQKSWDAFLYKGQVVILPGTEVNMAPEGER